MEADGGICYGSIENGIEDNFITHFSCKYPDDGTCPLCNQTIPAGLLAPKE